MSSGRAGSCVELNDAILRQTPGQIVHRRLLAPRDATAEAGRALTLASGGHPLSLVLRAYGGVERVGARTLVLGLEPDPLLEDDGVDLAAGDALVFYTDGLTDAHAPSHGDRTEKMSSLALRSVRRPRRRRRSPAG